MPEPTSPRPLESAEFAALIGALGPFERHPRLAVAVSGGPDSLCLCLLADHWARVRGGEVIALIVDHGLRDGGMREQIVVPAAKLHRSATLSFEQLALVETLGIGAHAVGRAQPRAGEWALVIGAGPIGLTVMQFALLAGARVIALDLELGRLEFCRKQLGVEHTIAADEGALDAIRELYEGGAPMSSQIARKVVVAFQQQPATNPEGANLDVLSAREKEILELLSRGMMYKEIAAQLFLSPETVRKHVYHIYEKLHVNNRVAAVNKFYGR